MSIITINGRLGYPDGTMTPLSWPFHVDGTPTSVHVQYAGVDVPNGTVWFSGWTDLAPFYTSGSASLPIPSVVYVDAAATTIGPDPAQFFSLTPGKEFATTAWCYQKLADNAPLDPNSAAIVNTLLTNVAGAGALYNGMAMPVWIVPAGTPTQAVRIVQNGTFIDAVGPTADAWRQQYSAVPIPPNFYPGPGTDFETVIYQPSTGKLWEGWQWIKDPNGVWTIVQGGYEGSMATSDGTWPPQAFVQYPGMIASGIHWLSFQVTLGDLKNQLIAHPVGIVIPTGTARSDVWSNPPAHRCDFYPPQYSPDNPAEGGILRLPANIDLNAYPATAWDGASVKTHWRLVAEAMRDYGCVMFDQGGGWLLAGEDQYVYGAGTIDNDPILSQVMGSNNPWGYSNQFTSQAQGFPFDKLQLLKMNLVSS